MNQKLCKKLKDAGFKECDIWKGEVGELLLPYPTLEELVEACGKEIDDPWGDGRKKPFVLWFNGTDWSAGYYRYGDESYIDDYPEPNERGSTPSEAVAMLWIKLNEQRRTQIS